jgi:hypothetical protein
VRRRSKYRGGGHQAGGALGRPPVPPTGASVRAPNGLDPRRSRSARMQLLGSFLGGLFGPTRSLSRLGPTADWIRRCRSVQSSPDRAGMSGSPIDRSHQSPPWIRIFPSPVRPARGTRRQGVVTSADRWRRGLVVTCQPSKRICFPLDLSSVLVSLGAFLLQTDAKMMVMADAKEAPHA